MVSTPLALGALGLRVLLLGYERILGKRLTEGRTPLGAALLFFGVGTLLWLPALLWTGLVPLRVMAYGASVAAVYAAAFFLYLSALARTDAGIVGPLYHTSILVVMLLSFVFLGEDVTLVRVLGGVLLLYGASLLYRQGSPFAVVAAYRALFRDRGAVYMAAGSALLGAGRIVDAWIVTGFVGDAALVEVRPTMAYAILQNLFISAWMLVVVLALRQGRATVSLARERPGRTLAAGAVNLTSYMFLLLAFTGLEASVAEPASAFSMVVTVVLAWVILREPLRDRLLGAVVMVAGTALLFL